MLRGLRGSFQLDVRRVKAAAQSAAELTPLRRSEMAVAFSGASPGSPMAEAGDLKSLQCGFDPHPGHSLARGQAD